MKSEIKRANFDYVSFAAACYYTFIMILGIVVLLYPFLQLLMSFGILFACTIFALFVFQWIKKSNYMIIILGLNISAIIILFPFLGFSINILIAYSTVSGVLFVPLIMIIPWIIYNFYILIVFSNSNRIKQKYTKSNKLLNLVITFIAVSGYFLSVIVGYISYPP